MWVAKVPGLGSGDIGSGRRYGHTKRCVYTPPPMWSKIMAVRDPRQEIKDCCWEAQNIPESCIIALDLEILRFLFMCSCWEEAMLRFRYSDFILTRRANAFSLSRQPYSSFLMTFYTKDISCLLIRTQMNPQVLSSWGQGEILWSLHLCHRHHKSRCLVLDLGQGR